MTVNHWHALVQRIPEHMSGLREDVATAFGIVENFEAKARAINGDATLSETGRRQRLQEEVARGSRGRLEQLKVKNRAAIASIAARRKALQPVVKDKTDIIGEMRRIETRRILKDASPAERNRLLFTGDADIVLAIIDARPEASGIDDDMRARVVEHFIEQTQGPALRQLDAEEEALEATESALIVAGRALEKLAETQGEAA